MKAVFRVASLLAALIFILAGCAGDDDYLAYQRMPMTLEGSLSCGGLSYDARLLANAAGMVRLGLSGSDGVLAGYDFVFEDGEWSVRSGDCDILLGEVADDSPLERIRALVSLDPLELIFAQRSGSGDSQVVCAEYNSDAGTVLLTIDPSGVLPLAFECGELSFEIESLSYE